MLWGKCIRINIEEVSSCLLPLPTVTLGKIELLWPPICFCDSTVSEDSIILAFRRRAY